MSAFSPWDTGPPGYMPPGSSQIFTTGGTAPLWSTAPSDFAPSFDEPRRSSHLFTYPDPRYRTHVDEVRSIARSDPDLDESRTRVIRARATTSTSASRRHSPAGSAVLPETVSAVTRSTADSGSRVTYATALSHMSSRLTYATARSRISSGRSNFASQSSSTISYYTASSTSHRTPSSATADFNEPIRELSDWKRYLLRKGLIPNEHEELNWSGRGQHAEYEVQEEAQIPLVSEGIIGHAATAVVDKVKCRRILLARKTIRCSIRIKRNDAAVEVEHLQKLRHANIIRIVGTYVVGKKLAILLYPVAEWNLETFLDERPCYTRDLDDGLANLLICIPCLANAVEFLHANTVKHMDIKPQNILLKATLGCPLKVFLADFGIARSYTTAVEAETDSLTSFTRRYAAPEVVAQEKRGLSADIFSLGCVFTEVLSHFRQTASRPSKIRDYWEASDLHSYQAEKNAFHPSEIRDFSYSSNIEMVVSFLNEPQSCFSTRSWLDESIWGGLSFLGGIRGLLIRMLSPTPSLRPSAREVAEQLQTPDFESKCNCGHESSPFEIAPTTRPPKISMMTDNYYLPRRVIILLWANKASLMVKDSVVYNLDAPHTFGERAMVVGSYPKAGLWFPDRTRACLQNQVLLTQLASRKCRLLLTRSSSRKGQLLLTWPSAAEESEESEDEVVFEGRRWC